MLKCKGSHSSNMSLSRVYVYIDKDLKNFKSTYGHYIYGYKTRYILKALKHELLHNKT